MVWWACGAGAQWAGLPSAEGGLHQQVLRDPINPNMPMLDDSMLSSTRGVLTFGAGMNLKMATTPSAVGAR